MLLVVASLIAGATYDLVTSASTKEQHIQESELRGQLAQFLLSIREPDGSTLLENPTEFSATSRALQVVSLRRFPFVYLLNAGNAKRFKTDDLAWESPRACQVEFAGSQLPATTLQACFAAIPSDPTGRYLYFSLRYPTAKVHRHVRGQYVALTDRVEVVFAGTKPIQLTLVFEAPTLALARYPSQMARFEGVHELTGFVGVDGGRPMRLVSAQAYESDVQEAGTATKHFVTVVGRIDSAMLNPAVSETDAWPATDLKAMTIGLRVYAKEESETPLQLFDVPPGGKGTPLVSLTQSYLAAVPSRAPLEVATSLGGSERTVWRSDDVGLAQLSRLQGIWQSIADWWAGEVLATPSTGEQVVRAQQDLIVFGIPPAVATLTATPITLPDIATRAFTWLTVVALLIALLALDLEIYLIRLLRLRGTAYSMAVRHTNAGNLQRFVGREREVGTLARIFNLLIKRSRTRSANVVKRSRREAERLRIDEAHVQNRKAILDAIGHEIRSPLQSLQTLLSSTSETQEDREQDGRADAQKYLARIRRAVEALYDAASVEAGLKSGEIILARHDLAAFLTRFASNLAANDKPVTYVGPREGITFADTDTIQLEQILDNLIDNAMRYRVGSTNIELRLANVEQGPRLTVFNQGRKIPDDELERIFDLGVSDSDSPASTGLGLFASRIHAVAMKVTLGATNEHDGVAFTLQFPSTGASAAG